MHYPKYPKTTIRNATFADVPEITKFVHQLLEGDFLLSKITPKWSKIAKVMDEVIGGDGSVNVLLVSVSGKEITGVMGGQTFSPLWNDDKIACELIFALNPKFKKDGVRLIKAFEEWARSAGCSHVQIGLLKKEKTTYLKGFISMEQMYMKELK